MSDANVNADMDAMAHTTFSYYNSLVKAGFTEDQALELSYRWLQIGRAHV